MTNGFEQLVSEIVASQGYWIQTSVKVELSSEEKTLIGRKTSPRWELDIVAYSPGQNLLLVIECKNRLDSGGIKSIALSDPNSKNAKLYKLFHDKTLRDVVMFPPFNGQ